MARRGEGKSGGFRTILLFRAGGHVFFVEGFAKSAKANVSEAELFALRRAAVVYAGLSEEALQAAVAAGELIEIASHDPKSAKAV